MCAVPAAAQLALRRAMVESPRWLAARGRDEESVAALAMLGQPPLRSTRGDGSVQSAAVGYADLFKPRYARATSVAVGMNLLQQLCGINVVVYYAPSVLSSLGFTAAGSIAEPEGRRARRESGPARGRGASRGGIEMEDARWVEAIVVAFSGERARVSIISIGRPQLSTSVSRSKASLMFTGG